MFDSFDLTVYAQRRARLAQQLGAGGVAVVPTAAEQPRNRDSDHPYRFDSYFHYLTGFTEPNACLVLHADGTSVLFCQPKNLEREIWDGIRLGPEAAPAALGVSRAVSVDDMDRALPELLHNQSTLWYPFATHKGLEGRVEGWLQQVRAKARAGVRCPSTLRDVCEPLDAMRQIKDAQELAIMRRAAQISAGAHVRAMQLSARRLAQGLDTREYHLEAEILHACRMHGAQAQAYTAIVAGGANACVLHYRADNGPIRPGELVLIDAGCELDGYASDITRTFPANGRFSGPQRTLYDIVLAAQDAAVAATAPGRRFNDAHEAALRVLTQGMLDTGLLDRNAVGTVDDALANKAYTPFYMHRTGHWLGMDVHDCGRYTDDAGQSLTLAPGMVTTIEPGIYVRPGPGVPEHFWHIGIRIEDDAVVTDKGCELITRGVPVDAHAIEQLMRSTLD